MRSTVAIRAAFCWLLPTIGCLSAAGCATGRINVMDPVPDGRSFAAVEVIEQPPNGFVPDAERQTFGRS